MWKALTLPAKGRESRRMPGLLFSALLLTLLAACATPTPTPTPKPEAAAGPAPPTGAQEMEVAGVAPEAGGGGVLVLRVKGANRILPVGIGNPEAVAIVTSLEDIAPPRPMTHDLLHSVIGSLEGDIVYVMVTEVVNSAFHAVIVLQQNGQTVEVDARTSDAVALALRARAPIYASQAVLDQASIREEDPDVIPL